MPGNINATYNQIREVQACIEAEILEELKKGSNVSMATVLEAVKGRKGMQYLQSEINPSINLLVNPAIECWTNWTLYRNDIAVVSSIPFINPTNNRIYYIGNTFAPGRTTLMTLPKW